MSTASRSVSPIRKARGRAPERSPNSVLYMMSRGGLLAVWTGQSRRRRHLSPGPQRGDNHRPLRDGFWRRPQLTGTTSSAPGSGAAGSAIAASAIGSICLVRRVGRLGRLRSRCSVRRRRRRQRVRRVARPSGPRPFPATVLDTSSSAGYTPTAAGTYWWYASYGGDANDVASASACGSGMASTVVANATTATAIAAPMADITGGAIAASAISASLSGGTSGVTGTITFKVFGPQATAPATCTTGGTTVGTATVSGNGAYAPSAGYTPTAAARIGGRVLWR